jgi:hypothetical protein
MLTRRRITAICMAALCFFVTNAIAEVQIPPNMNKAQILVFFHDHLKGIEKGSHIDYAFKHDTKGEKGFTDHIGVDVTAVAEEGKRDLSFNFLTGENHIDFTPAKGYRGNPVIFHFLERDISLMARDTGGYNGYYRNRIRDAFKKPDQVEDVTVDLDGKPVTGTQVVVSPFVGDPNADKFKMFENKRYEFIFSDNVPGGVYRIHTQVPDKNGKQILIDEDMVFSQITP